MADDYTGDENTTGVLLVNGSVKGRIDSAADEDWFRLDLKVGGAYVFTAVADDGGQPEFYVHARGYSPLILYTNAPGYINSATLDMPYSHVDSDHFYMSVKSDHVIGYTIGISQLEDDHLDSYGAAMGLLNGTSIGARIDFAGDREYFKIEASAGSTYKIRLTADSDMLPAGTWLESVGEYGDRAAVTYSKDGDTLVMTLKAVYTKDYYVTVNTDPAVQLAAPIKYHVDMSANIFHQPPDDYGNGFLSALTLDSITPVHARLDYAGDVEYFRIASTKGSTYTIRLDADLGTLPPDAKLWLADNTGIQQANAYMDGSTMVLQVTAAWTGILNIGVGAGDTSPLVNPVPYHVSMTLGADAGRKLIAVDSAVDGPLKLTFDGAIKPGTGAIELYDSHGTLYGTWQMSDSHVTLSGNAVTIDLSHNVLPGAYMLKLIGISGDAGVPLNAYSTPWALAINSTADGGNALTGTDSLSAWGDNDVAVFAGRPDDYKINYLATDFYDIVGAGSKTTLTNIERVMFTQSDDVVALSQNGQLGQAWRLYQAAFDRAPDKGGLGYWLLQQQKGLSLDDVAQNFLQSKEFVERYGVQSNAEFVNTLYRNVLHREGDAGGLAFHVGTLDHGASRADVLTTFSESPENQAQVASLIGNGIVYTPYG